MNSNDRKVSYFNTLLFTIITGIVSLCILALLFFEFGKKLIYFIIAFEVGVFILIAYCIYKIVSGEKKKLKSGDKYVVRFDECPDYYTKKEIDGKVWCYNDYVIKDLSGKIFVIRLTPSEINNVPQDVPTTISVTNSRLANDPVYSKFELKALETDDKIPSYEDKCKLLFKMPPAEDKYTKHMHYTYIPWTYAKSRCASLAN